MKEEKNIKINLSFDMIKKIMLGFLGVYFLINLVTNIYIDVSIGEDCKQVLNASICDCVTTGIKKSNIFNKMSFLGSDLDSISISDQQMITKCISKTLGVSL